MARQGRCVAEAGVKDAASRAASKYAEAWVCPPASFPSPPLGSDSLSPVPPPLPGFRSPARRLREARRAAGRRWWVGSVGRNAPAGSFATGRATRRRPRGCCRCRRRGRVRALMGPALYRGGTPGRRSRRRLLGAGPARVSAAVQLLSAGHGGPRSVGAPESRGLRACRPRPDDARARQLLTRSGIHLATKTCTIVVHRRTVNISTQRKHWPELLQISQGTGSTDPIQRIGLATGAGR